MYHNLPFHLKPLTLFYLILFYSLSVLSGDKTSHISYATSPSVGLLPHTLKYIPYICVLLSLVALVAPLQISLASSTPIPNTLIKAAIP